MSDHESFMREAIRLARLGVARGDGGPFGAVVVWEDRIVGRGWNRVVSGVDPTAHAEMEAIRDAARRLGRFHLAGCAIYTVSEPCPMCLGAAYWAHVERIYFAADVADAARVGFADLAIQDELALGWGRRRLPAEQLLREAALEVFEEWRLSDRRVDY